MDFQVAQNLGQIHKTLGIDPSSRVVTAINYPILKIWSLTDQTEYTIDSTINPPTVTREFRATPEWIASILSASDDELFKSMKLLSRNGNSNHCDAMFTELCIRGFNVLGL